MFAQNITWTLYQENTFIPDLDLDFYCMLFQCLYLTLYEGYET